MTNKTQPTSASVDDFLATVDDDQKREDSRRLATLMEQVTGEPAVMWGPAIVGFGSYHYRYASGREGDAPLVGFSPRKASLTVYAAGASEDREEMLARLGPHTSSLSCIYLKRLADVDEAVLVELIEAGIAESRAQDVTS